MGPLSIRSWLKRKQLKHIQILIHIRKMEIICLHFFIDVELCGRQEIGKISCSVGERLHGLSFSRILVEICEMIIDGAVTISSDRSMISYALTQLRYPISKQLRTLIIDECHWEPWQLGKWWYLSRFSSENNAIARNIILELAKVLYQLETFLRKIARIMIPSQALKTLYFLQNFKMLVGYYSSWSQKIEQISRRTSETWRMRD